MSPEIIGTLAGILTTLSFFPQTIKALKAKDTKAISLLMYSSFTAGVCFWFVYGILKNDIPIIIFNAITIPLAFTILVKKISNIKKGID
jgi:MtN3 and saliva related transmembrane protein